MLEELVPRVYRFAVRLSGDRHVAEDLCQEAMLRAWRCRRQLRDSGAAHVWLFRIVVNVWRERQRRIASRRAKTVPLDENTASPGESVQRRAVQREDLERAYRAMDLLPPRQREVIHLHVCESLSITEVADVLGITINAAKANLSIGRKRLRYMLKDVVEDFAGETK
jgi:RNA polymerase sigma-70 factor (ECF subfamily)